MTAEPKDLGGPSGPPYTDRYPGLVIFGILEVLMGLFIALGLIVNAVGLGVESPFAAAAVPPGVQIPSVIFNAGWAALFIILGIGSMLPRRWARALTLILAWFWLFGGLIGLPIVLVIVPEVLSSLPQGQAGTLPPAGLFQGCLGVVLGVFVIVLPALFVLFYRSRNVKATCEARDPRVRWTDRRPLPVLACSLLLALAAAGTLLGMCSGVALVFGRILSGPAAIASGLVSGVLLALLSRAVYRQRPYAWWLLLGLWLLGILSTIPLLGLDWREVSSRMGVAPPLDLNAVWRHPVVQGVAVAAGVACLGFILWLRRFFRVPGPPLDPSVVP